MEPADLLPFFAVPHHDGAFLLGCRARRITVYDQQVRALNLVVALHRLDRLKKDDNVAVVGAGIGGLTAAVAAARLGARVHVYDRANELITFQRHCPQRLLHPRIYNWPEPESAKRGTGFPLMKWEPKMADEVARELLKQWDYERGRHSIQCTQGTMITGLRPVGGAWSLEMDPVRATDAEHYTIVILALGFGVEKALNGLNLRLYWRADDLDATPLDCPQPEVRYLVAGSGDGALIDVLRTRFSGFHHDRLLDEFGLGDPSPSLPHSSGESACGA